ncbi:MAG: hypothetical protein AAFZ89_01865 [Bacteroidota bacterium]
MKNLLFFFGGAVLICFSVNAQSEKVSDTLDCEEYKSFENGFINRNIDPRQYVSVYQIKNREKKKIWHYNKCQNRTNQLIQIIDASGKIQIEFDKEGIARNENFKGNITIEGKIVSKEGGEDPVEVFPYSRIGQEKTKIGITNRPPHEIATVFVNLILECLRTKDDVAKVPIGDLDNNRLLKNLSRYIETVSQYEDEERIFYYDSYEEAVDDPYFLYKSFKGIIGEFLNRKIVREDEFPRELNSVINIKEEDEIFKEDFVRGLKKFQEIVVGRNKAKRDIAKTTFKNQIKEFNKSLKIIIDYIDYFKSSGEQAEDAFLSTIQLDHIALDQIEINLKSIYEQLIIYLETDQSVNSTEISTIESSIESRHGEAVREITRLTQLKGTDIEKLQTYYDKQIKSSLKTLAERNEEETNKKSLIKELALKASEIIYRDLNYATINLKKERAQEGDYLYMYLVLEESKRRNNDKSTETIQKVLPIGSYEIRNTKWEVKISDSFLLVNRINEPSQSDDNSISPSNFKGAPGASLLLTYRRDGGIRNKLVNSLEPSFGINVSYVDFSTEDDVEVGAGLVLGLFNNKLFFTGGVNLNRTGRDETRPIYWGIGFSFTNLASKIAKDK